MLDPSLDALLTRSFDDHHLARGERQALAVACEALDTDERRSEAARRAFDLARAALMNADDRTVVDWLEGVLKALQSRPEPPRSAAAVEAHFSPGDDCPRRIAQLLAHAHECVDICVFTITDDRIAGAILDAHRRRVALRIITDNEKVNDEGSDIARLEAAGIAVRVDRTSFHMHHKFALFDRSTLLTGSYNWTRGAAQSNDENFIVTDDARLIGPFGATFERIWKRLE